MTKTYEISGPTDEVAIASLKDELSLIDGAHDAEIDLAAGRLILVGDNFADEDVRRAADTAGYRISD